MGWLHNFNLKRKVSGVLAASRGQWLSVTDIAHKATAQTREVEDLLDAMVRGGLATTQRVQGAAAYQLNEGNRTVHAVLTTLNDPSHDGDEGLTLRPDTNGWTAELPEPAGMLVRGATRQEARDRGIALMQRMAQTAPESRQEP